MARMARLGIERALHRAGLRLLDAALAIGPAAARPGGAGRRRAARAGADAGLLPAPLRGLIRAAHSADGRPRGSLARRLAGVPETEREGVVLELVCAPRWPRCSATTSPRSIDAERTFKELGFDSLSAVELRNRLAPGHRAAAAGHAGLRLPHPPGGGRGSCSRKVEGSRRHALAVAPGRRAPTDPVVIVGMSCRYPGGVRVPEELWQLLARGRRRDLGLPRRPRLGPRAPLRPRSGQPGHQPMRARAGSCTTPADFDAALLRDRPARGAGDGSRSSGCCSKSSWEALERAGIDPSSLRGSQTGVFAGVMYQDYARSAADARAERAKATGHRQLAAAWSPAGVAYVLGPGGPGDDGGHRLLLLAGGAAPGVPGAARRASARWRWRAV